MIGKDQGCREKIKGLEKQGVGKINGVLRAEETTKRSRDNTEKVKGQAETTPRNIKEQQQGTTAKTTLEKTPKSTREITSIDNTKGQHKRQH